MKYLVCVMMISLCALPAPGRSETDAEARYAERFIETAETVLAPVYPPLADDIVGAYGLADAGGTGIDIGGGPGHLAVELAVRTPSMYWVNADINPGFFPHAAKLADRRGVGSRIGLIEADVHDLPFRDGYADIVVSRGSFPFWRDLPAALGEIYRVLKPGGAAFIGRGFPENLPPATARAVREKQGGGGGPSYDASETAALFVEIMRSRGVEDFRVHRPSPAGAAGVNYGVWLEFKKPGNAAVVKGLRAVSPESPVTEVDEGTTGTGGVYVLDPLEVRGRPARDVMETPLAESAGLEVSESVVTREDIRRQGSATVIEALEYVPGARVETRGRKVKQFFSVRGQTYPYPNYAVDGALFREFHEVPYFFSAADVERIEVLRSSAAMLTGSSGLAGVVNIVPRRYGAAETSYGVEYGSFDTYRAHLAHGATAGDVSYSLSIDTPHTRGPDGRHAAEAMSYFQGTADWRVNDRLSLRSNLFHVYGKREVAQAVEPAVEPAGERFRTALEEFDPFSTTFASLTGRFRGNDRMTTEVRAWYADRDHTFRRLTGTGEDTAREWDFEWGLNAVQALALTSANTLRGGVYYTRWVAPYGKRFFSGRACDLETFSAALVDEHRFGRLLLDGGLKLDRTYIHEYGAFNIDGGGGKFRSVEPVTDKWEPVTVTARMGGRCQLSEPLSLHANAASGVVRPREGSLDTGGDTPGNETRTKLDAGVRFSRRELFDATVTGFLSLQRNAIVLSGQTMEHEGRIMELYLNRDQRQAGLELNIKTAPVRDTALFFFNAVLMKTEADAGDGMKSIDEYPEAILGGGVHTAFAGYDANLFWKYISDYENNRFAATPEPEPLGGFNTVSCTIGRTVGENSPARIYVEVDNIFDTAYSTVVGYPDYGRRYTVGVSQSF